MNGMDDSNIPPSMSRLERLKDALQLLEEIGCRDSTAYAHLAAAVDDFLAYGDIVGTSGERGVVKSSPGG
jgi:hypothetical protein